MFRVILLIAFLIPMIAHSQAPSGLLENHFKTIGQDQWNELRTVVIDGKWVDEDYYGYPMKLTAKSPDKIRIQGAYHGEDYAEAYNGFFGWVIAPWKRNYKVQKMDDTEELIIRNIFSFGSPLYLVRDHVSFTGLMDMDGALYHTYTLEEGDIRKVFYIDRDDHHLYYEQIEGKFGSAPVTILKIYENYKNYGPLSFPSAVRFEGFDIEREFVFDEVLIGAGANDALFEMPDGQ